MIVVVDYKMGNIGSILNILKKLGHEAIASDHPLDIERADKLILPGVGAFDTGVSNLEELDLIDVLHDQVLHKKKPILGICVGMQLMAKTSEEGEKKGFGWFDADVKKFNFDHQEQQYRIPCVGWNIVRPTQLNSLFSEADEERFYFVHSYYVNCKNKQDVIATAEYGFEYAVAVNRNNIYGVQFHPEKSHKFGLKLIKNFIELPV